MTIYPLSLKYLVSGLLQKKFADPWSDNKTSNLRKSKRITSKIKVKAFLPNKSGFQYPLIIVHAFWLNLCNMKLPTGPNYKGQHDQRGEKCSGAGIWEPGLYSRILSTTCCRYAWLLNHSGPLFHSWCKTLIRIKDFRGTNFVFCIFFMLQ